MKCILCCLSSSKCLIDVLNALNHVLFLYIYHCICHHSLVALIQQAHKLFGPALPIVGLDLTENELNRVVLWTIWHVVDETKAVLTHGLL